MAESKYIEALTRIAAGQVDNPVHEAAAILGDKELTVDKMLAADPLGLNVEFNEITTDMLVKWGKKRKEYIGEAKNFEAIEWWQAIVKAAIVAKWFQSPSDWVEGSVGKMLPAHTHWLADLVSLHSIEIKRVPFLST